MSGNSDDYMLLGMLTRRAADHQADVRDFRAHIAKLEKENANLRVSLAMERANGEGLTAVMSAFKTTHPQSPLMEDSGLRYKDRDIKRKYALVYEAAFDKKARELGLSKPERYRAT